MNGNRFAALVDTRGFAKLEENKNKRRRNYFEDSKATQKYVVVKRINNDKKTFNGVSPFLIEKGLSMITPYITETQRLRSGELLVLTNKEEGYCKLMKAVKLAEMDILVEEHKFLNLSKGVIYSYDLMHLKEEEITKELESQKVTKVERMKRKINNELKDTPMHIITFNTTELPLYIKAGFLRLDVRQYIPNPMRCHNCQRYGHTKTKCERMPVCPKCAKSIPNGHESIPCEPVKCANCRTEHTSFDKNCPTLQMEKAIIKIKTIERITYFRAKEVYYRQNANTTGVAATTQGKQTYSDVLQQNGDKQNVEETRQKENSNDIINKEKNNNIRINNNNNNNNDNSKNNNKINNIQNNNNSKTQNNITTNKETNETDANKNVGTTTTITTKENLPSSATTAATTIKTTTTTTEEKGTTQYNNKKYSFLSQNELSIALGGNESMME